MSPTYFGTSGAQNSVWHVVGIQKNIDSMIK